MQRRNSKIVSSWQIALMAIACLLPQLSNAATLNVCSNCAYTTVNNALSAAHNGDTIRVAAGHYDEDISISLTGALSIQGGYSSNFSQRNPSQFKSRVKSFSINNNLTSNILISGFEITGSGYCGVYVASAASNVTVEDCDIHDNDYIGIFFTNFTNGTVRRNAVYDNGWRNGMDLGWGGNYQQLTVSDNTVYSYDCVSCSGIYMQYAHSGDAITGNHLYGNKTGLEIRAISPGEEILISGNKIHNNSAWGISMQSGSPVVEHNILYLNAHGGMYHWIDNVVATPAYHHNVFAENGTALRIQGTAGKPSIKSNVFDYNQSHAVEIAGFSLWGATNILPTALKYNAFSRMRGPKFSHTSMAPSYSFNSEQPGAWDDINSFEWSEGNFALKEINFQNVAARDYTLRSNSFLVDEDDPEEDFSQEPAPNGGRVNVGVNGGTSEAINAPALIGISNVSTEQSGDDILVHFNTTTDTAQYWIFAEILTEDGFEEVDATDLSDENYQVGYRGGRIEAGSSRTLSIVGAGASLLEQGLSHSQVRLRIEHGNRSATATSAQFSITGEDQTTISASISSLANNAVITSHRPILEANITAEGSPVQQVRYSFRRGSGEWTTLNASTDAPYRAIWGANAIQTAGIYTFKVTARNAAGKEAEAIISNVYLCGFTANTEQLQLSANAQTAKVVLTSSDARCNWNATPEGSWIKPSKTSGSGNITLTLNISANSDVLSARTGKLTIGGKTISIKQSAKPAPDLQSKILKMTKDSNKAVTLQFSCTNYGEASSTATTAQLLVSKTSTFNSSTQKVRKQETLKSLAKGKSQTFSFKLEANELSGYSYIAAKCDGKAAIEEIDEANNVESKKF